jgi:hypothetical protein
MTPLEHDGRLYVVASYPGADRASNARAAGAGTLSRGRKSRTWPASWPCSGSTRIQSGVP